jgi:hypothetical protein
MTIAREFFREQMSRLERQFNAGRKLDPLVQEEYFMTMNLFAEEDLVKAVDGVIQTHRPYPGHIFPSISVIIDALNDIMSNPRPKPETPDEHDFCERCRNGGFYMAGDRARFCDCMKGRRKEIDFRFHPDKKRAEEEKGKIKNAAPSHRGLKEWNPAGFYEDTQEEHDKWMTAEKAKIAEIDAKRAKDRGLGVEGMENAATGLSGPNSGLLSSIKETLGEISGLKKTQKGLQEDEEDAERAF